MSKQISVDMYAGGLVFWKATMVSKALLDSCNDVTGVEVNWKEIPLIRALEKALVDFYFRQGKLIRAAKPVSKLCANGIAGVELPSFVVVNESKSDQGNQYDCGRRYWIDPGTYEVSYEDESGNSCIASHIDAVKYRGMVNANRVSDGLDYLAVKLGGFQLRDNARIYYMPKHRLGDWTAAVGHIQSIVGLQFFTANCPSDAQTAAAVADQASVVLKERYQQTLDEIFSLDSLLNEPDLKEKKAGKLRAKRVELEKQLEAVKKEASLIDQSFRGYLDMASDIESGIDQAMAIAVLATSN